MDTTQIILFVLSALAGLIGSPIISWIKNQLGVDNQKALAIATGVSILLGLIVAVVAIPQGQPLTAANVMTAAFTTFSVATLIFKGMQAKPEPIDTLSINIPTPAPTVTDTPIISPAVGDQAQLAQSVDAHTEDKTPQG
jgi:hypothetical protein